MPPEELRGATLNLFQAAELMRLWGVIVNPWSLGPALLQSHYIFKNAVASTPSFTYNICNNLIKQAEWYEI